jgi:hypothetical protein
MRESFTISPAGDSITCARCGRTSYNFYDVAARYCGRCNVFLGDATGAEMAAVVEDAYIREMAAIDARHHRRLSRMKWGVRLQFAALPVILLGFFLDPIGTAAIIGCAAVMIFVGGKMIAGKVEKS